jgi:hypothetical protein
MFSFFTSTPPVTTPPVTTPPVIANYLQEYLADRAKVTKANIFKQLAPKVPIDISSQSAVVYQNVFIIDATGSMQSYIDSTKVEIKNFIKKLRQEAETDFKSRSEKEGVKMDLVFRFETAIVAYRDFSDAVHFETHDFTSNVNDLEKFLNDLRANGGHDHEEDVYGAFLHALKGLSCPADPSASIPSLSWFPQNDLVVSRNILWLADAPPHGQGFTHSTFSDRYHRNFDSEWKLLFQTMKDLDVTFFAVKLNDENDMAIEKFQSLNNESMTNESKIDIIVVDVSQAMKHVNHSAGTRCLSATSSAEFADASACAYESMSSEVSNGMKKKSASTYTKVKSLFTSSK